MRSKIGAGIVAGLGGGVVLGVTLALMQTPRPTGDQPSILFRVGRLVGSDSIGVSWLVVIAISALLGAVLAAVLGGRARDYAASVFGGLIFAIVLWVGLMVLMPVFEKQSPFSALRSLDAIPVAIGSLLGLVLYGAALGAAVPWLLDSRR